MGRPLTVFRRRYDTHSHRLADYPALGHDKEIFPGQDYSNPRIKDFANGMSLIDFFSDLLSVSRR
jgi:phospholipase D1/2